MILEGIVTTVNADGTANISPMGPLVDQQITQFVLRPYTTSRTYQNLKSTRQGVLHVTDDVELLARAAVHRLDPLPKLAKAKKVRGFVLADACRWYEFEVSSLDDRSERTTIACRVVGKGRIRELFGFNRAKHVLVEKTAGPQERRAFQFLNEYVGQALHARQTESGV